MSLWPSQGPPPEQIIITEPDVWNSLTLERRKQHISRIKQARMDCRAYGSMSLAGNTVFLAGAALGGVLSMLAPSYWTLRRRSAPFIIMGLAGIYADNLRVKQQCEQTYPEPAASLIHANGSTSSLDSPLSLSLADARLPSTPLAAVDLSRLTDRGTIRSPNLHSVEVEGSRS